MAKNIKRQPAKPKRPPLAVDNTGDYSHPACVRQPAKLCPYECQYILPHDECWHELEEGKA